MLIITAIKTNWIKIVLTTVVITKLTRSRKKRVYKDKKVNTQIVLTKCYNYPEFINADIVLKNCFVT